MFTKLCFNNAIALACSAEARCFHCFHCFDPRTLTADDFTDDGKTAICTGCLVDAVLPGSGWTDGELAVLNLGHFGRR